MPLLGGVTGAVIVLIALLIAGLCFVAKRRKGRRKTGHKDSEGERRCSNVITESEDSCSRSRGTSDPDVVQYQRKTPSLAGSPDGDVVDVIAHGVSSEPMGIGEFFASPRGGMKHSITATNVSSSSCLLSFYYKSLSID